MLGNGWPVAALLTPSVMYLAVFPSMLWQLMAVSADRCHRRKCAESPGQGRGPGALGFSLHLERLGFRGPLSSMRVSSRKGALRDACLPPVLRSRGSWVAVRTRDAEGTTAGGVRVELATSGQAKVGTGR